MISVKPLLSLRKNTIQISILKLQYMKFNSWNINFFHWQHTKEEFEKFIYDNLSDVVPGHNFLHICQSKYHASRIGTSFNCYSANILSQSHYFIQPSGWIIILVNQYNCNESMLPENILHLHFIRITIYQ